MHWAESSRCRYPAHHLDCRGNQNRRVASLVFYNAGNIESENTPRVGDFSDVNIKNRAVTVTNA